MRASWIFSTTDVQANLSVILAGVLVMLTGSPLPDLNHRAAGLRAGDPGRPAHPQGGALFGAGPLNEASGFGPSVVKSTTMYTQEFRRAGRLTAMLALSLAGVPASALAAQEAGGESVRVCTFPAPGFFIQDANGVASGLEFDLLTSFAAAAKVKLEFEALPLFDQVLKDTESGKCQIGAATVTVTGERKALLAFSNPYFPNRVVMVQKSSSGFTSKGDLKDRRVAVVSGTLSISLVNGIQGVRPVVVDRDDAAFEALQRGEADAVACDSAVVLHYLTRYPDLAIAFPMSERSFFAFVLPKGSKLLGPLNNHLKSVAKSGAFTKLLAKHFGETNAGVLARDVAQAAFKP